MSHCTRPSLYINIVDNWNEELFRFCASYACSVLSAQQALAIIQHELTRDKVKVQYPESFEHRHWFKTNKAVKKIDFNWLPYNNDHQFILRINVAVKTAYYLPIYFTDHKRNVMGTFIPFRNDWVVGFENHQKLMKSYHTNADLRSKLEANLAEIEPVPNFDNHACQHIWSVVDYSSNITFLQPQCVLSTGIKTLHLSVLFRGL